MKRLLITCLLFVALPLGLFAQNEARLAAEYMRNGEFEKASSLYEKLYKKTPQNQFYFTKYLESMIALEQFDEAEKVLKKQIKSQPNNYMLFVDYGRLYEKQFEPEKAQEQYLKAIDKLPADQAKIINLARNFMNIIQYDLAAATYEKGQKLLKDKTLFAYELGDLYRRKGDSEKMIENYLNSLELNPGRANSLKTIFQRYFSEEDFTSLQTQLYARIQKKPDIIVYPEMLTWMFIQQKDFTNAFRQVKALDKRLKENGGRIYNLAKTASREKDYDAAIEAYDYIINTKGKTNTYYLDSKREALNCKRQKLTFGYKYTTEELKALESEYEGFLAEFGRSKTTAPLIRELATLEALYINDLDKAISLLEELIAYPGVHRIVQAESKLDLGDYYLMQGEIWESSLLYSQVDKTFKDDILGELARFKNAKLSYYNGDFEWAQGQLTVLKASTSELIANDALDLSVFIMDNLALDTVATPMEKFAEADLLVFQNRFAEAFKALDEINKEFPAHSLEDDIYFTKAKIYLKQRKFDKAIEMFDTVINGFADGIKADNSLFELAELYELHLDKKDKARELYERIILEYSGSTFAVQARKRFRALRGDGLQ